MDEDVDEEINLSEIEPSPDNVAETASEYTSCIRINGRPILPPVMSAERRQECREWRRQAISKENELRQTRNQHNASRIKHFLGEMKRQGSGLTTSASCPLIPGLDLSGLASDANDPVTDLTPKSFRDVQRMLKEQRGSELDTERSSSSSFSISGGISSASSVLGYNSNLYSDQEGLESDNRLQFDDNHRTELYDSLLSLNTVIENPSSRLTVHDGETQSLIEPNDSLTLSIPGESGVGSDLTITEINAVDANFTFSEKKSDEEPKENVQPDLPNVENTMDGEYTSEEPSLLSSEEESDKENFRPRRGSYSLDKPSPLLQAHLDKFGKCEDGHDMSNYQRTPSPCKLRAPKCGILTPRGPSTETEKQSVLDVYLNSLAIKPPSQLATKASPRLKPEYCTANRLESLPPNHTDISLVNGGEEKEVKTIFESASPLCPPGSSSDRLPLLPSPLLSAPTFMSDTGSMHSTTTITTAKTGSPLHFDGPLIDMSPTLVLPQKPMFLDENTSQLQLESESPAAPSTPSLIAETPSGLSTRTLTLSSSTSALEQAVNDLARSHQESLARLIMKQEEERKQLRQEFEDRQKVLIQQIVEQFPNLGICNLDNVMKDDIPLPKQTNPVQSMQGSSERCSTLSPCNKQVNSRLQSEALAVSASSNIETFSYNLSNADTTRNPSPSIHWKADPSRNGSAEPLVMPEEVYAAQYSKAWVRLTALARGYLVRKLLATEKVQFLKRTIRETLACAVRLHLEIEGAPSRQDLELHGRLLAQLESACQSVHHIFFKLGIPERMSIIALDRSASMSRSQREVEKCAEKKVSAATLSRLEQKSKECAHTTRRQSPRWLVKRRRTSRSTSRDGRRRSTSARSVQLQSLRPTKSSHNVSKSTGSPYKSSVPSRNRPAWK